ncbi:MAG: amidohydrolase [Peptococcaceae bacterium]|nr:amidohydrolase [Peptococcaceae bacterium]MBP3341119.1 amidohydrolase [Peptococcaceae bacterium]MBP3584409.1 amidohydrolase [Peptococcaceae bacterium]
MSANKIWIQNTQILTMTGAPLYTGDILIENDIIKALGTVNAQDAEGAQIIDGRRTVAMPGLVNTHTHAAMTLLRSYADDMELMPWLNDKIWPAEAKFVNEYIYWGSALAAVEMIQSGTTTFADMYDSMHEVAKVTEESGLRANLARGCVVFSDPELKNIQKNVRLYENFNNTADGRIKVWFAPHAPYTCPPEYVEKIVEAAKSCNAGIHVHLAETLDEQRQIAEGYGKTPTEYLNDLGVFELPTLAAHSVYLNDSDIAILKEHNVGIAHNPSSNLKLASGIANIPKYLQAGLNIGIGTDGCSSNNTLNMFKEMTICSFVQKVNAMDPTVLPAEEILRLATIGGAKALRWDDEIGTLEVGKKADLILVDIDKPHFAPWNNPVSDLVYSAQGSDVKTTIVNGKLLMKDYEVLTLDVERIMAETERIARNVL